MIIAANNAMPKLLIEKSPINQAANWSITALITNKNKPSVSIVIGKVKNTNKGFINKFNKLMTKATKSASEKDGM